MSAEPTSPTSPTAEKKPAGRFRRLSLAVATTVGALRRGSFTNTLRDKGGRAVSVVSSGSRVLTTVKRRWRRGSTDNESDASSEYSESEDEAYDNRGYDYDDDHESDNDGSEDEVPEMGSPTQASLLQKRVAEDIPGQVADDDDRGHLDWEDELTEDDFEALEATLARMQPKCRPPASMVVDVDLQQKVKNSLHPARHWNAMLSFGGTGPRSEFSTSFVEPQAKAVPQVVLVSGHSGAGGNIALNGIYERYPSDYHGRAVFQKVLEKRARPSSDFPQQDAEHLYQADGEQHYVLPVMHRKKPKEPLQVFMEQRAEQQRSGQAGLAMTRAMMSGSAVELDSQTTCLLARAHYKSVPIPKPPAKTQQGDAQLVADVHANRWFLFFDRMHGWWCIGARPGAKQIVARCGGSMDLIPDSLRNWEVWDAGLCQWRRHERLRTFKG
eukprot:CAMPEP_0178434664 /NCGR_PEP_ID=MMETSP0689_2-20121128/33537_1 /TAXON_ID=160604 /ORGANISM="Amphidinium massartii, Strain CS-259" /LENGTH=439 /DNA_ID=CAMNT_0020056729 /DNA_START=36 /DNA_END=1351 /DNA_ORIENTATION=+